MFFFEKLLKNLVKTTLDKNENFPLKRKYPHLVHSPAHGSPAKFSTQNFQEELSIHTRIPITIERLDRRAEGEIACYGDKAEITECSKNSEMYCFSCCETIELATQYSHREI